MNVADSRSLPVYFLPFVSAMVALAPFAIDTYLPALPAMADAFGTDIVQLNYTVSTYLLGFGAGQLLGGPISDQLGRRPIGFIGLTVFILGSVAICFAGSVEQVQWLRPVQAIGGGLVASICNAMVRDSYSPTEAAKRFPIVMLVMLAAPLIAPIVGTTLLPLGWESIFFFLAAYAAIIFVVFAGIGETNRHRSGELALAHLIPQYLEVVRRRVDGVRVPLRYILTQGFVASTLMVFLTNASFIYLEYFAVSAAQFPLYFGANVLAMMVFTLIAARLVNRVEPYRLFRAGIALQLLWIVLLVALVYLGNPPLNGFTALVALVIGSAGLINSTSSGLLLANFRRLAGSAGALMSTATFTFGAALGALSGLLYDGTLEPVVTVMAGSALVANLIAWTIPAPRNWSDEAIAAAQSDSRFD
ncbi:MAG: multidrug effflux MFS transporter [Pseudomonadota bacterium]